jgi:hypothetical protein
MMMAGGGMGQGMGGGYGGGGGGDPYGYGDDMVDHLFHLPHADTPAAQRDVLPVWVSTLFPQHFCGRSALHNVSDCNGLRCSPLRTRTPACKQPDGRTQQPVRFWLSILTATLTEIWMGTGDGWHRILFSISLQP